MIRLLATTLLLSCATSTAFAAATTDVADAFDQYERGGVVTENKLAFNLRLWFDTSIASGKIQREPVTQAQVNKGCSAGAVRNCVPIDEAKWNQHTYWVKLEGELGLWKDLSLTVGTSYAISQQFHYNYADGQNRQISSVDNDTGRYFDLAGDGTDTKQHGWGSLDFVLHYALTNTERDDTVANWVLGLGLSTPWISSTFRPQATAPTGTFEDPRKVPSADPSHPQGVGDGLYRVLFSTAFSKPMLVHTLEDNNPKKDIIGYVDPYITLNYALPIPSAKAVDQFRVGPFKHNAPHVFELRAGIEWVPYHDTRAHRRAAFQFGGLTRYYTAGNTYSILTPALGDITYAQGYFDIGTQLAALIQVSGFVHLNIGTQVVYTTGHFLTGRPQSKDGQQNPYYCGNTVGDNCNPASSANPQTYDAPGTRFKDAGHVSANFYGNVSFTF